MSIRTKMLRLLVPLVGLVFASIFIYYTSQEQVEDAYILNLMGQQRMLSQKVFKELLLFSQKIEVERYRHQFAIDLQRFDQLLRELERRVSRHGWDHGLLKGRKEQLQEQLRRVHHVWEKFTSEIAPIFSTQQELTYRELQKIAATNLELLEVVDRAVQLQEALSRTHSRYIQWITFGLIGLFLFVGGYSWRLVNREVIHPIVQLQAQVAQAAKGDLCIQIVGEKEHEVGQLARDIGNMISAWRKTLLEVDTLLERLREMTEMVYQTSQSASEGALRQTEQSHSIVKAASELSQTIQSISHSSSDTAELAGEVQKEVTTSMGAVEKASQTIYQLAEQGQKVAQINQLISEISDKMDILALNAAIEAVREGENSGFSIVAREMRGLAEKVSSATGEVQSLTQSIQSQVEQAVFSMERLEKTFGSLKEYAQHLYQWVAKLDRALQEQASVSETIFQSTREVLEISEATYKNSKELLQSFQELKETVQKVSHRMEFFHIES